MAPSLLFIRFLQKLSCEYRVRILFCTVSPERMHFVAGATRPVRGVSENFPCVFPHIVFKHLVDSFNLINRSGFFHMHDYL